MIGKHKFEPTEETIRLEIGDRLKVTLKGTTKSLLIKVTTITNYGRWTDGDRRNLIIGKIDDVTGHSIVVVDNVSGQVVHYLPNAIHTYNVHDITHNDTSIVYEDETLYPSRVKISRKQVLVPVKVGDELTKPNRSGVYTVVYVNDTVSNIVVERDIDKKIEVINFKDTVALEAFGLKWRS